MSPVAQVAMLTVVACGGLAIAWSGVRPKPASLAADLVRLDSPPPRATESRRLLDSLGGVVYDGPLRLLVSGVDPADLRLLGRTPQEEAARRASVLAAGLAAGPVLAAASTAFGVDVSPGEAVALSVVAVSVGFVRPRRAVSQAVTSLRRAYRWQLSMFLLLVGMCLSAGFGVETALKRAVTAGRGGLFEEMDKVMGRARLHRQPPWPWLLRLGDELGLGDLADISENVALAGDDGASVQETVTTKADALLTRILTEDEGEAAEATEAMWVPTVVLFFAFLAFILVPAMSWGIGGLAR